MAHLTMHDHSRCQCGMHVEPILGSRPEARRDSTPVTPQNEVIMQTVSACLSRRMLQTHRITDSATAPVSRDTGPVAEPQPIRKLPALLRVPVTSPDRSDGEFKRPVRNSGASQSEDGLRPFLLLFSAFFSRFRVCGLTPDRRVPASRDNVASNCSLIARSASESPVSASISPSNGPL